jgi:aldose 1-epimerase
LVATHTLRSAAGLEATVAPELAMVVASLRHDGDELLGQRHGLEAYARTGSTMGIPLLHPWANRLGGFEYSFGGRQARVDPDSPDVRLEENNLPNHGLRAALTGWGVVEAGGDRAVAGLDYAGSDAFPFPHRIEVAIDLVEATLAVTTTLTARDVDVPVCFGHHPYLRLPGVPRAEWDIRAPVDERLLLDDRKVPTGERAPAGSLDGPLGDRTFDDAFTVAQDGGAFAVAGGGRRIEVAFARGYPYAQIFAPDFDDVVCFEPMTAPADALRHGPPAVPAGEAFSARFEVSVARAD